MRLINEPVKVAWVDGELLLEAHPPVDAEGQSFEPDVDQFAALLRAAVGDSTVAIHWDYAREVLQKADGVLATVGLEADLSALNAPEPSQTTRRAHRTQPRLRRRPARWIGRRGHPPRFLSRLHAIRWTRHGARCVL